MRYQAADEYIRQASLPCRKCKKKPEFVIDNGFSRASEEYKLICSKCSNQETEEVNPMDISNPRLRAAQRLLDRWNTNNRLELEWFPERQIPRHEDLRKWDSQNSLRPSKMPESST